jgi:hypothetical protein
MGWFSKRGHDRAQEPRSATRADEPQTQSPISLTKVDEVIAAAETISSSTGSEIQRRFDYVSTRWGCEAILILDKATLSANCCAGWPRMIWRPASARSA